MKFMNNEKGMALPLVLIVMVVVALLGAALWQYSMSEMRSVAREEARTQAFYVARSGAETVARYIRLNPSIVEELFDVESGKTLVNSDVEDLGNEYLGEIGEMRVSIEMIDNKIEITGYGDTGGVEQTVTIILELKEFPSPDAVVITTSPNHLDFHPNMTVNGSIVAGGPVTLPNSYVTGETAEYTCTPGFQFPEDYFKRVVVPEGADPHILSETINNKYTIYGGEHHQIDNLTNSGILEFDFSESPPKTTAILVVTDLDLKNKSEIVILGSGKVEIYIRETAQMHSPKITYPENAQLQFFLAEGSEVSLNGNVQFDGLFYGPYDTHVKMQSNTSVNGAMIVGTLSGQGGTNSIGASGTVLQYYEGFGDLEFLPIVNQLHWKP